MRRGGFVLMALATVLVAAGFIIRLGGDNDPVADNETALDASATVSSPTTVTGPAPPSPAACEALVPLRNLLEETVTAVSEAFASGDDADLANALQGAVDRGPDTIASIVNLEALVPPEIRSDVRATAMAARALLGGVAEIDVSDPDTEIAERIQTEIASFQANATAQGSFTRLNSYLNSCS